MRVPSFVFAASILLASMNAWALDAGADAGDAGDLDATAQDAQADATADAEADAGDAAGADAAVDASKLDAAADGPCDPSIEPCTTRADASTQDDAGTGASSGGGCSCDASPLDAGSVSPLALVAAAAFLRARRKKNK